MAVEPRSDSWLNRYVARRLGGDPVRSELAVVGEISGGKLYPSGHYYFTLKDQDAQVSCVFFGLARQRLAFRPENGMKVLCYARAGLYQKDGRFQLTVVRIEEEGIGDLHRRFLETKERLEKEGLFAAERKKEIPVWPARIGVVTSMSGAVLSDILFVLRKNAPSFDLLLYPAAVQGADAPAQIAGAVRQANRDKKVDVLIVGRGGGSFEDLFAFNEEIVVRAVFDSEIPVISAVGHETDITLIDFAADLRMPTPSAAAARVMPSRAELAAALAHAVRRMETAFAVNRGEKRRRLAEWLRRAAGRHPSRVLEHRQQALDLAAASLRGQMQRGQEERRRELDRVTEQIGRAMKATMLRTGMTLSHAIGRLGSLNPEAILGRGYAYVTDREGRLVPGAAKTAAGAQLQVHFHDGKADVTVDRVSVEERIN